MTLMVVLEILSLFCPDGTDFDSSQPFFTLHSKKSATVTRPRPLAQLFLYARQQTCQSAPATAAGP